MLSVSPLRTFISLTLILLASACTDASIGNIDIETALFTSPGTVPSAGGGQSCGEHGECEEDESAMSVATDGDWAKSTKKKNNCVPASAANAAEAGGIPLVDGLGSQEAADEVEACLRQNGCWNGCGFGPPDGNNAAQWTECFEVLCDCLDEVLEGDGLMCDFIALGNTDPNVCSGHEGSIGFVRDPRVGGSHAVTITEVTPDPAGGATIEIMDPDKPGENDPIFVEPGGLISEANACWITEGNDRLAGCFVFDRPL